MLLKDFDFIIPQGTICLVNSRDSEWNLIGTIKTTFIRIPVMFRVLEVINLIPGDRNTLIIDLRYK